MPFCQNCGQEYPNGAQQCPRCGVLLMQQPMQPNQFPQQQFNPNINMQQPKKKRNGCLIAVGVLALLSVLGAAFGNDSRSSPEKKPAQNEESVVESAPKKTEQSTEKTSKSSKTEKTPETQPPKTEGKKEESSAEPESKDQYTFSQRNAISSAKTYIKTMAFSYEGLISQLEFEQYSHEDAVFGAENCGADWNAEAIESAKGYLATAAFSYDGLVQQLEFEQFTSEQAAYGANNCNADWNEEAAQSARNYLSFTAFSRDELIQQLVFEGFTYEQAEYGVSAAGY